MNDKLSSELNIRIDQLVVEGISLTFYQRQLLMQTVESELRLLFSSKGIPEGINNISQSLTAKPIALHRPQTEPVLLGKQVATSLYDSLKRET
jgi:hypothetical protein